MINETMQTFGYPGSLLKEYNSWVVVLRPSQVTVGSLVIITKTDATNLGKLSEEKWAEFSKVSSDCEKILQKTFGAEKFNYLALMMKDPNVHFHFIPRYSKPVVISGKEYADTDWPLKTELNAIDVDEEGLREIKQQLESNL